MKKKEYQQLFLQNFVDLTGSAAFCFLFLMGGVLAHSPLLKILLYFFVILAFLYFCVSVAERIRFIQAYRYYCRSKKQSNVIKVGEEYGE